MEQERGRRGRKRKMSGGAGKEELGRERARSVWPAMAPFGPAVLLVVAVFLGVDVHTYAGRAGRL